MANYSLAEFFQFLQTLANFGEKSHARSHPKYLKQPYICNS